MAVTPIQYVFQAIDKSTGAVKAGVNVKITNDGGSTFLPSSSGINTDANGVAIINVSAIGSYDVYLDGTISTDYQAQTVIPLENNLIRGVDTDGDFTGGSSQTDSAIKVRGGGNTIEFGNANPSGYGCNIGAQEPSGKPFIAFFSEKGANNNTYRSRGIKPIIFEASTSGDLLIGTLSNTSADNQTLVQNVEISSTGDISATGNIQTGSIGVGNDGNLIGSDGLRVSYVSATTSKNHNSFVNGNGSVGTIATSGTSTSYNTSSDPRLKTEFKKPTKTQTWAKFKSIFESFGIFQFKTEPDKDVWGFDAHKIIDKTGDIGSEGNGDRSLELGALISEAEYKTIDIPAVLDENGNELEPARTEEKLIKEAEYVTPAGVDQSKVVPYLVACIEDLRKRIEILEKA